MDDTLPQNFRKLVDDWAYVRFISEPGDGLLEYSTKDLENRGIKVGILKRVLEGMAMTDSQRATETAYIEALKIEA